MIKQIFIRVLFLSFIAFGFYMIISKYEKDKRQERFWDASHKFNSNLDSCYKYMGNDSIRKIFEAEQLKYLKLSRMIADSISIDKIN